MIGSFEIYGLWLFILACGSAMFFSATVLLSLLIHFGFREKGESWPSASPGFRAFLSAGTLVILNILAVAAWFVLILPTPEEFRRWFDSVVLYAWVPMTVLTFLLIYFSLRVIIPRCIASTVGWFIILAWASLAGTLSILVAIPSVYILIVALFQP